MKFGIRLETGLEALQVGKAELLGDDQHLRLIALDLVQADLMDHVWLQVRRGFPADAEGVIGGTVGQGPDAGFSAAGGHVGDFKKMLKAQVGGQDFLADHGQHFVLDALLLVGGNGRWKALERHGEG